MIGRLTGVVQEKNAPWLLLDVNGVGYEVETSLATFCCLPATGDHVSLWTHLQVREDAQHLFGFREQRERELFRNLIRVNGVGPRLALAILSGMDVDGFIRAVAEDDTSRLVKLPGVGKKTAQRLVLDMRDRIEAAGLGVATGAGSAPAGPARSGGPRDDAVNALVALGYREQDAVRAIDSVGEDVESSEELIRAALQLGVR